MNPNRTSSLDSLENDNACFNTSLTISNPNRPRLFRCLPRD